MAPGRDPKVSTRSRRGAAISARHEAGQSRLSHQHIAVRKVMAGIRRVKGTAQTGKRPVITEDLRAMVAQLNLNEPRSMCGVVPSCCGLPARFAIRNSSASTLPFWNLGHAASWPGCGVPIPNRKRNAGKVGFPHDSRAETSPVRARPGLDCAAQGETGRCFGRSIVASFTAH